KRLPRRKRAERQHLGSSVPAIQTVGRENFGQRSGAEVFFLNARQLSDEVASVVAKVGAVRLHKDGPARDAAGNRRERMAWGFGGGWINRAIKERGGFAVDGRVRGEACGF